MKNTSDTSLQAHRSHNILSFPGVGGAGGGGGGGGGGAGVLPGLAGLPLSRCCCIFLGNIFLSHNSMYLVLAFFI